MMFFTDTFHGKNPVGLLLPFRNHYADKDFALPLPSGVSHRSSCPAGQPFSRVPVFLPIQPE